MIDNIYKVMEELEKYKEPKEDAELLNDINTIDGMVVGRYYYNEEIVNNIIRKYESELDYLVALERKLRNFQQNQSNSSSKSVEQYLLNLRHSLVRVGVLKILRRKGKKMLEDDLINNNNSNLYVKFIGALNEK